MAPLLKEPRSWQGGREDGCSTKQIRVTKVCGECSEGRVQGASGHPEVGKPRLRRQLRWEERAPWGRREGRGGPCGAGQGAAVGGPASLQSLAEEQCEGPCACGHTGGKRGSDHHSIPGMWGRRAEVLSTGATGSEVCFF